jgi:hypothetical protein
MDIVFKIKATGWKAKRQDGQIRAGETFSNAILDAWSMRSFGETPLAAHAAV